MQAAYSYSSDINLATMLTRLAHKKCSLHTGPLGSGKLGPTVEDDYEEAFDEGAAQVQRLLSRDRKELTGIEDIGQGFQTEFDENVPEKEIKQPEKNGTEQASAKASSFSSGATLSHLSRTLCDGPSRNVSLRLPQLAPARLSEGVVVLLLRSAQSDVDWTLHGLQENQPRRLGR